MSSTLKPETTETTANSETTTNSETTAGSHPWPKQKVTAITRLKSFSGSLLYSNRKTAPIVFPPPSWELSDELLGNNTSSKSLLESNFEESPPVEPVSFAQRLRGLIEALPRQLPGSSKNTPAVSSESLPNDEIQGSPIPPGLDQHIVRLLSSEDVMNGELPAAPNEDGKRTGRIGIWNILAGLRNNDNQNISPGVIEEKEDGVMMYAPLEPKSDSQVELASSETVLEYVDERGASKGRRMQAGNSTGQLHDEAQKKTVMERQVWVPSTIELSVLTTWWGYRLYLPPPVMEKLNGTSVKATARAAMITTALKWLLDKIPIALVPIQFRPAVKMLKQLSPVVGYIGIFIAWSWDRVRALDNGNGVVLTATWLLPVALVPMSWDAGDIYGPPPPPKSNSEESHAAQEKDKSSTYQAINASIRIFPSICYTPVYWKMKY
ncbi:hypothetical protein CPB84DRAFT_529743 [Gymnopilus junonius]|uniref:Uncharacterized protein n=1 Tax=Gymnopilus junonius TaxID=109634 RepID=A0A9P5P0W8_GYMJU|nr:hypothetical protein CPB84DRAFT_529743 [Gymnopilus junonius]